MIGKSEQLKQRLRDFAAEREWDQFHSPKDLSMALNEAKYPAEMLRGSSKKYTEYWQNTARLFVHE